MERNDWIRHFQFIVIFIVTITGFISINDKFFRLSEQFDRQEKRIDRLRDNMYDQLIKNAKQS